MLSTGIRWQRRDFFRQAALAEHAARQSAANALDSDADAIEFDFEAATESARYNYVENVHSMVANLRACAFYCLLVATTGICLMIVSREIEWSYRGADSAVATHTVFILRCINTCVTICLLALICRYHSIEHRMTCLNLGALSELAYWPDGRLRVLLLELAVCVIHDAPGIATLLDLSLPLEQADYLSAYFGYDIVPVLVASPWSLLMFARVYLLARVMRDRSFSSGANILGMFSNFPFTTKFALRAIIDKDALPNLCFFVCILIAACSYCLHVCERPNDFGSANPAWNQSYSGAVWLTIITFATVGYGDLLPLMQLGRAIMLINAILGTVLVSGILSAFNSAITMLPFESRMSEFMSFELTKQRLHNAASSLIAHTWRWYRFRKHLQLQTPLESTSFTNSSSRFVMEQSWLFAMNDFYVAYINFRQYDGRFQGDAHVAQCLRIMLRRASLCANHIFGIHREKTHVDNFIVNQMSIILTRNVKMSKVQLEEGRIAGLVSRQRSLILKEEEANAADREQRGDYSDSDDGSDITEVASDSKNGSTSRLSANQLVRRRIQRRQQIASIASDATISSTDIGRRRISCFRFVDAPSALQRRLPGIRAANPSSPIPLVDALESDTSMRTGHDRNMAVIANDSTPSKAWQEIVDDQSPALSLKLALQDIRTNPSSPLDYDSMTASGTASSRSMTTARKMPTLFRSGSLRASDVLQFIARTPPVMAEIPPHGDTENLRRDSPLSLSASSASPLNANSFLTRHSARSARRRARRRRAPGAHHHHHHLHRDLPLPAPNLVERA